MSYVLIFLGGAMLGGIFGVFTLCMIIQAGQADEREERMNGQNNGSDL